LLFWLCVVVDFAVVNQYKNVVFEVLSAAVIKINDAKRVMPQANENMAEKG
jgi:hypothetical protein